MLTVCPHRGRRAEEVVIDKDKTWQERVLGSSEALRTSAVQGQGQAECVHGMP